MDIHEWIITYVKHKDVLTRKLLSVEDKKDHVLFKYKDNEMTGYAYNELQIPKGKGKILIATLQKKENIDFLVKHWKDFSSHEQLTIVFVNMNNNEKWLLHPYTHARIAEEKAEPGIRSMADAVTYM